MNFEDDSNIQNVKEEKDDDLFDFDTIDTSSNDEIKEPSEDAFTEDLQKELEAKFDELFGPME